MSSIDSVGETREEGREREKNGRKVRQYHGLSKWVSLLHFNLKAKRQNGAKTIQNNSGSMESMDLVYFTRLRWIPIFWDNKLELAESMSSTKLLLLYFDDFYYCCISMIISVNVSEFVFRLTCSFKRN